MAEDRVSAFLAREKADLGDIIDEFPNDAENKAVNSYPSDIGFNEESKSGSDFVIEPEDPEANEDSSSASPIPQTEVFSQANQNHGGDCLEKSEPSSFSPHEKQESALLGSWKMNFEADIKSRDEKEAVKLLELQQLAQKELETWYAHYRHQLQLRSANNRMEVPKDASGKAYDAFSGQAPSVRDTEVWKSVCDMCDLTSKNSRSIHDLSRMRGLLLNLKTAPSAQTNLA